MKSALPKQFSDEWLKNFKTLLASKSITFKPSQRAMDPALVTVSGRTGRTRNLTSKEKLNLTIAQGLAGCTIK